MSIFNISDNIKKVKFGEVFNIMKVIELYKWSYCNVGLFFAEPELDMSPGVRREIPNLIRIPIGRDPMKDLNKEGDECIRYVLTQLETLPDYQIDTQKNIPQQLLDHFNTCPSIQETEIDSRFIVFDNNIDRAFRMIVEQHTLRQRMGIPGFNVFDRCGYIHFSFYTKLIKTYREGLDCVHWFLPVELKEGWS